MVTVGNIERFMPGFSSLSDAERWDVVAYALSLSSSPEDLASGEEIYQLQCSECHGEEGMGTEAGSPLAIPAIIANQTIAGIGSIVWDGTDRGMPDFSGELTEDELQDVSAYVMGLALTGGMTDVAGEIVDDVEEPVSGEIRGQAINGSDAADRLEGLHVSLHGFEGQQEVIRESGIVDEGGMFSFGEIDLQPGWVFVATLEHEGVMYGSEIVEYIGDEDVFLPLTFFDTSEDASGILVDRLHTIFSMSVEGVLEITELWIISNFGDHTIATLDGVGVLEISLPDGATNLRFDSGALGDRFFATENGFIDTLPMRPGMGTHEVVFSFEIPYEKRLDFKQPMDYPVDAVVILTPATGPELEGDGIIDLGSREMSGNLLRNYNAESIEAGGFFEVTLRGSGVDVGSSDDSTLVNVAIGIGSLVLAAGTIGIWWFRRQRTPIEGFEAVEQGHVGTLDSRVEDQEALMRSIAKLDDAFEAGGIEEAQYQERRAELKEKLLNIMRVVDHD
jgi:mono/diheme cytochrome c family protein